MGGRAASQHRRLAAQEARRDRGRPTSYTPPRQNEIVIKNHAVAVNPLDRAIQLAGNFLYRWIKYPAVIGTDVAGEVVHVGSAVTRFKAGDRVLGHAVGVERDHNTPAAGEYQAAPEPHVVGHGLRHVQAALDTQMKGVSAAKIVVSLDDAQ